jgi:hypothetical protein
MRAAQTLYQSHRSTQMPDHVLHVARAKGGSSYPKFPQEWLGLLCRTVHQAADDRVQLSGLACWSSRLDIREACRMFRRVSVDRRRRWINTRHIFVPT